MKKPEFMTYEQWLAANPDMAALHEEEPEPCEECDGDGTVACMECLGETTKTCIECNGIGSLRGETEEELSVECSVCGGNGLVDCPECGGEGHYDCEECGGTGEIDPARVIYDEQLAADKQKLEEFINFHKRVSGRLPWDERDRPCVSNLPYNNT